MSISWLRSFPDGILYIKRGLPLNLVSPRKKILWPLFSGFTSLPHSEFVFLVSFPRFTFSTLRKIVFAKNAGFTSLRKIFSKTGLSSCFTSGTFSAPSSFTRSDPTEPKPDLSSTLNFCPHHPSFSHQHSCMSHTKGQEISVFCFLLFLKHAKLGQRCRPPLKTKGHRA